MTENIYPGYGCLGEENPDEVTIKETDGLCASYKQFRELSDNYESKAKEARAEMEKIGEKLQSLLGHFGRDSYQSPSGTIEVRTKLSFKTPKLPEQKKAFFEWLQGKGIFWEYASVNSVSLNALCKQEAEIAKDENKEFNVPGIEPGTEYKQLAFRSKK